MNYVVFVPQGMFDLLMFNWLVENVSQQQVSWKCEIDDFERRCVFFKEEQHSLLFKETFKLR